MGLYGWIDYMTRTLISQRKPEQDKKYKDASNTIFTYFLMIIDLQSGKAFLWNELLFWLFCGCYLHVNTDIDIPIVQPNGNNWSW